MSKGNTVLKDPTTTGIVAVAAVLLARFFDPFEGLGCGPGGTKENSVRKGTNGG